MKPGRVASILRVPLTLWRYVGGVLEPIVYAAHNRLKRLFFRHKGLLGQAKPSLEPTANPGQFFAVSVMGETVKTYIDGQPVQEYSRATGEVTRKIRVRSLDPTRLAGSKLKIERAKCHIQELEAAIQAFHDTNPYDLIHEIDPGTGENVWRVVVKERLPSQLSAIIGDAVHNLRCALDYLVCDLVRWNGAEPHQNSGLQISPKAESLKPGTVPKLKGVSPKAERCLLRLKAGKRTNTALFKLNLLDVFDKHSAIVTVAAATVQIIAKVGIPGMFLGPDGNIRLLGPGPGGVPYMFDAGTPSQFRHIFPLEDQVEVHRSPAGFNEELQLAITVAFGKTQVTEGEPFVETLKQFTELLERIIAIFEVRCL